MSFLYTHIEWVSRWMFFAPQGAAEINYSGHSLLVIAIGVIFLLLALLRGRKILRGK